MLLYEDLSGQIIGAAIEVHRHLGPGLLESAYQECLYYELNGRGFFVQRQLELPVVYKGLSLDCGYRLDLVVEDKIILEIKAVESLVAIHQAQLLTYLKLSRKRLGFLLNFNTVLMKDGIERIVL